MEEVPFGRYRLRDLLGKGGMGRVYRAYDTATDRIVAVKVLPDELAGDATFQQRFRGEAHKAAALNEPHVIPIHSFGEIEGRLYVDMRLIEGQNLDTVLREGKPLEPARAVAIIDQVASALDAAHKVGLVHRDVKPSNILLTEREFVYLIDFGIARGTTEQGMTQVGQMVGTWAYMAPERFETGKVDPRSDVYALVCVLYECLTNRRPYPGETLEQQMTGHLAVPPPRPSLRPGVSSEFDAVIAKGMAKDPSQRYQTTLELAAAAKQALNMSSMPQTRVIRDPLPPGPATGWPPTAPPTGPATGWPPTAPPTGPATGWPPTPPPGGPPTPPPTPVPGGPPTPPPTPRPGGPPTPPPTPRPGGPPTPPPTPRPQERPWWRGKAAAIGGVVVVLVGGTVAGVVATSGDSERPNPPPPPGPTPSGSQQPTVTADSLLLDASTIDSLIGTTGLAIEQDIQQVPTDDAEVIPPQCYTVRWTSNLKSYGDIGYTDYHAQLLQLPDDQAESVLQSVLQTSSSARAQQYLDDIKTNWQACNGQVFTVENVKWQVQGYTANGNIVSILSNIQDATLGQYCEDARGIKKNFVVAVSSCHAQGDASGLAVPIVEKILSQIK